MSRSRRDTAVRLRSAVEALPRHTKEGMLRGICTNRVIVGAYTDTRGGVCPMLAAHRNGGRTNFSTFAKAWDAFTGARRPRRASVREVRTLRGYLEAALIREGVAPLEPASASSPWAERPLTEIVRELKATRRRRAARDASDHSGVTIEELLERTYREETTPIEVTSNRAGAANVTPGDAQADTPARPRA
jgi:hypothetical protein